MLPKSAFDLFSKRFVLSPFRSCTKHVSIRSPVVLGSDVIMGSPEEFRRSVLLCTGVAAGASIRVTHDSGTGTGTEPTVSVWWELPTAKVLRI